MEKLSLVCAIQVSKKLEKSMLSVTLEISESHIMIDDGLDWLNFPYDRLLEKHRECITSKDEDKKIGN